MNFASRVVLGHGRPQHWQGQTLGLSWLGYFFPELLRSDRRSPGQGGPDRTQESQALTRVVTFLRNPCQSLPAPARFLPGRAAWGALCPPAQTHTPHCASAPPLPGGGHCMLLGRGREGAGAEWDWPSKVRQQRLCREFQVTGRAEHRGRGRWQSYWGRQTDVTINRSVYPWHRSLGTGAGLTQQDSPADQGSSPVLGTGTALPRTCRLLWAPICPGRGEGCGTCR